MLTETQIEDDRWQEAGLSARAEVAARATLVYLGLDPAIYEISLLGCDDARIAVLNGEFRDKPGPTNVLSWPAQDLAAEEEGEAPYVPETDYDDDPFAEEDTDEVSLIALGDIAIAYDTCAHEAQAAGRSLSDHMTHLIVHGTLHLLGYDHIRDKDATLMETIEVAILGKLGVADPY